MEHEFRELLFSAMRDFGVANDIDVTYPNRKYTPSDEPYLKLDVLPITPDTFGVTTGCSKYQWIFQVSVFVKDGKGEYKPLAIADTLRDAFPFGFKFIGSREYQVTRPADVKPPVRVPGWFATPIHFRIQTIQ